MLLLRAFPSLKVLLFINRLVSISASKGVHTHLHTFQLAVVSCPLYVKSIVKNISTQLIHNYFTQ